jgi:phosphotransferase family enzyme
MSPVLMESLTDLKIPTLHAVLDPSELSKYLAPILDPGWGMLHDIEIRVLQHHRGSRCAVDIKLLTTTGSYELVGKVYSKDRSDVYRAMNQIIQSGFGPEEEFSIPRPLTFIPELRLLLQEKIQGTLLTKILTGGNDSERIAAIKRCARWLARFHDQARMSGPTFFVTQDHLQYWVRRLAKRAGEQFGRLVDKAVSLRSRLEIAAGKLDHLDVCACHGTYCHYQIILTETRTVTLDWDGFCVSHPSLDLARFIIVLQQLGLKVEGSLKAFDVVSDAFYRTYTGQNVFQATRHLPFYKAAHCLKHAKHHLKPGNGGIEMAEAMLDEGVRILSEEM